MTSAESSTKQSKKKSLKGMFNVLGGTILYHASEFTREGYERRKDTIEYTPPPDYSTPRTDAMARRRRPVVRIREARRDERLECGNLLGFGGEIGGRGPLGGEGEKGD